ncbi:probably inactive leucine-rich repeat receptor-like protein kinase At5g48380 [Silene latifolia]|uniref:probably inactive leucine-rich repeat receptor-like protein kinase At5g48380 n=1 Tax=Silene latifolia TaxID=37657 RepID=UPI003D77D3BF
MASMTTIITILIIITTISNIVYASTMQENDILCLKSIKSSIQDPHNSLTSWQFPKKITPGFICSFAGIQCWNALENRVLNIDLSSLGLKGEFPSGIFKCESLSTLILSNNKFYGSIPSNISTMVPFIVNLSLSSNDFSGEIPASLGNFTYLNSLELDHNRFSGRIPSTIGSLARLREFSVANNLLVGPIPHFESGILLPEQSYWIIPVISNLNIRKYLNFQLLENVKNSPEQK